jgi:hypothetical protein
MLDMSKLLLVALPALLYAAYWVAQRLRGQRVSSRALHIHASLLLAGYFFATAAAGVFWVANQQLPPFDLHYLLGYVTAALVRGAPRFQRPERHRPLSAAHRPSLGAARSSRAPGPVSWAAPFSRR